MVRLRLIYSSKTTGPKVLVDFLPSSFTDKLPYWRHNSEAHITKKYINMYWDDPPQRPPQSAASLCRKLDWRSGRLLGRVAARSSLCRRHPSVGLEEVHRDLLPLGHLMVKLFAPLTTTMYGPPYRAARVFCWQPTRISSYFLPWLAVYVVEACQHVEDLASAVVVQGGWGVTLLPALLMTQQNPPWVLYVGLSAPRAGESAALVQHHMRVWHLFDLPEHALYHPVALRMVGSGKHVLDAQACAATWPQSRGKLGSSVCCVSGRLTKTGHPVGNEGICARAGYHVA